MGIIINLNPLTNIHILFFLEESLTVLLDEAHSYISLCIESKSLKQKEIEPELSDNEKDTLDAINYFITRLLPLLVRTVLRKKLVYFTTFWFILFIYFFLFFFLIIE